MDKKHEPIYKAEYLVIKTTYDDETSIERFDHYSQAVEYIEEFKDNFFRAWLAVTLVELSE